MIKLWFLLYPRFIDSNLMLIRCWLGTMSRFQKVNFRTFFLVNPWYYGGQRKNLQFLDHHQRLSIVFYKLQCVSCIGYCTIRYLHVSCLKLHFIYYDNQGDLHIAADLVFHEWTKHLKTYCHSVWEKLQIKVLKLLSIFSSDRIVDFFM